MYPTEVRFLSDGGDWTGFDWDLMDRYREEIARRVKRAGEPDSQTIRGGFLTLIETPDGDYITASWYWSGDAAMVFSVAPGFVEEPPV